MLEVLRTSLAPTALPVAALAEQIGRAQYALVGERHGVRAHPVAAACLLRQLAERGAPAVVLEMLTADQQATIDAYRRQHPEVADGLGTALKWWESGWPAWPVYAPLFAEIWRSRGKLLAGDVAKAGPVPDAQVLATTFGREAGSVRASWSADMQRAHCDLIDKTKAGELGDRQAGRDMAMTAAVASSGATITLLYAGRAHIRSDRSVGLLLAKRGKQPVTIALQETTVAGRPVDRARVLAEAKGRFDVVWFTGIAEQPDACERLRSKGPLPVAGTTK